MNVQETKISVIVPAYNEKRHIAKCIHCLQSQDFHHGYEMIVVDNNSTDTTKKIAQNFTNVRVVTETGTYVPTD